MNISSAPSHAGPRVQVPGEGDNQLSHEQGDPLLQKETISIMIPSVNFLLYVDTQPHVTHVMKYSPVKKTRASSRLSSFRFAVETMNGILPGGRSHPENVSNWEGERREDLGDAMESNHPACTGAGILPITYDPCVSYTFLVQ